MVGQIISKLTGGEIFFLVIIIVLVIGGTISSVASSLGHRQKQPDSNQKEE